MSELWTMPFEDQVQVRARVMPGMLPQPVTLNPSAVPQVELFASTCVPRVTRPP